MSNKIIFNEVKINLFYYIIFVIVFILFFSISSFAQSSQSSTNQTSQSSGSSLSFFSDVPPDHWAYQALVYLFSLNIVQGYKDGTFKGDRNITRYEMALIIYNLIIWIKNNYDIKTTSKPNSMDEINEIINTIMMRSMITEEDAKLIKELIQEFRLEIETIKEKLAELDKRVSKLENNNIPFYLSTLSLIVSLIALIIVLIKN
ncbi:MAG: S-layer homology domain-containing protein [Spirochaetes bacterium]|nr:S-layer homology domain-containing protein [Spirochaetota bacterium]